MYLSDNNAAMVSDFSVSVMDSGARRQSAEMQFLIDIGHSADSPNSNKDALGDSYQDGMRGCTLHRKDISLSPTLESYG
jgi:hypothetical protein